MSDLMRVPAFVVSPLAVLAFAAQGPDTLTPEGPATLYSEWRGPVTLEGGAAELLTGFRVTVQPGGRAGTIRFLVKTEETVGGGTPRAVHVGPPVTLPAESGTYLFPAPHVLADYREISYGIEQQTGGHAIAAQIRCEPADGDSDVCNSQSVDVYTPVIGGAFPDRRTATDVQRGRKLLIDPITEFDQDGDGAGDTTEDRTNLRASATTTRLRGNRRAFDVTVENAGPRTADKPAISAYFFPSPGLGTWAPACRRQASYLFGSTSEDARRQFCLLAPLAVGEQRTVRLVVPDLGFGDASFTVRAEGPDLAAGDQDASPTVRGPRPRLSLEVDAHPRLTGAGLRVTIRAARAGTVRLQARRGSRTTTKAFTLRKAGSREVVFRIPERIVQTAGTMTLTARQGAATARARVEPR